MPYGLTFTNNSNVVTLDSEFARLVVLYKGSWTNGGSGAGVSFPSVITSAEPPLVFVRPGSSCTMCFCRIIGSPGAWTGFSFQGTVGQVYSGSYFAAAFKASEVGTYGLRLWDGAAKILFDSANPCAQFTKTITSWTYLGVSQTGQGSYQLSWTAPTPLNTGEYMLINNIAMDVAGSTSRQGNQYAVWDYANNRLVMQVVGFDIQTTLYTPVVWAKPIS